MRRLIGGAPPEAVTYDDATAIASTLWSGHVDQTSAQVAVTTPSSQSVRLAVSTSADLTVNPVYSSAVTSANRAKLSITGLSPNTQYHYGIRVGDVVYRQRIGKFKTAPSGAASFSFGFGSCYNRSRTGAHTTAFQRVADRAPRFFIQMGDLHYQDNTSTDPEVYKAAIDTQFGGSGLHNLFSTVPTYYMADDHDSGGGPDGDSTGAGHAAWKQAYRERVPHAPTALSGTTDSPYTSWIIGRVRFVLTDQRTFRSPKADTDNSSKTMLGTGQKAWFKGQIDAAAAAGQAVIWFCGVSWKDATAAGGDAWDGYNTERVELANYIAAAGMGHKTALCIGDMHALAYDAGTNYATSGSAPMPVFHAAPLFNDASQKGGPYTTGPLPASGSALISQYGMIDVADDGSTLTLTYKGYDSANTELLSATVTLLEAVAPVLSSPTDAANGSTAATLAVTTDEGNGTLYWFVSTSATPPSSDNLWADFKNGTGAASFGNQAVTGTGVQNVSAGGLTSSTAYYAHFLHVDARGNHSAIVSGDGFTTGSGSLPAPTLVQSRAYTVGLTGTQITSDTVPFPSAATAGNTLVLIVGVDKAAGTFTAPAGYTKHIEHTTGTGVSGAVFTKTAAGGETDATVSWTNANYAAVAFIEVSGPAAVDQVVQGLANVSTTSRSATATTGSLAAANELALAFWHNDSRSSSDLATAGSPAWNSGWTSITIGSVASANPNVPKPGAASTDVGAPAFALARQTVASSAAITGTFSYAGDNLDECMMQIITLRRTA